MALIGANELKRKLLIAVEGQPYLVLDVFFASPTARGGATMVRTRLRHVLTNAVMEKSFRSSEKFEEPDIETVPASYLYNDAEGFHFITPGCISDGGDLVVIIYAHTKKHTPMKTYTEDWKNCLMWQNILAMKRYYEIG